ncbi:ARM repeat superfamily protein [Abeliophyllum distichum]|uniref:ARM repeat superfamily protein n=1 Tax=Abeliophyllum distichum TaxID=126358 RepID=A0ABD1RAG4_9LAMI
MSSTIPIHFNFKASSFLQQQQILHSHVVVSSVNRSMKTAVRTTRNPHGRHFYRNYIVRNPVLCSVSTRACSGDGGTEVFANQEEDVDTLSSSSSRSNDGYVALFARMLGLDNDPRDREQAVVSLWKYSLGGKQYVDNIMKFRGTINLTLNLLKSESDSACEAAAGLLRVLSSFNVYRDSVAESGAIEEITGLLRRSSLSPDVKEQSVCALWNLSVDEKLRVRIANSVLLPILVKFLEDDNVKVRESAGGVLANLALSQSNHKIMVEAGVIPNLAKLLNAELEESKVVRKEARSALLELAKDEYSRILVMEEGLVLVPLVGSTAYKSFRPALYSWPSLPDGTKIEQGSKGPSRFGASELLLGLNIQDRNVDLEEAKMNAVVGRTHQQFLARIGAIEMEDDNKSNGEGTSSQRFTLLPWMDAVARLVLILELEDESAITRAAQSIADASFNERMRFSFMEAGAIKHLIQLINHPSDAVRSAVILALYRLSISDDVCLRIEAEGVLHPLINLLKQSESATSQRSREMIVNILSRILDPNKEMKSKFYDGPVNGSKKGWDATRVPTSDGNETIAPESSSSLRTDGRGLVEPTVLSRLVGILKKSHPDLQRKAASILEFIAVSEPCVEKIISADIESGLEAVFQQKSLTEKGYSANDEKPELQSLELEEAGQAVSAASRLLARLLDYDVFRRTINPQYFTKLLRDILVSSIPLHNKDWVAACLVKLSSLSGPNLDLENPVNIEVTLYETIPRLIEQIKSSFSPEVQEAAVLELNRIISEGLVDSTRVVAADGAIFPLVKLLETGTERAVEASLTILYSLSMDNENHAAIISAGAVPILRRIVLSERSNWMRALRLLRALPT